MSKNRAATVFIEVFPVITDALPKLSAYLPTQSRRPAVQVLAEVTAQHAGAWALHEGTLLTDTPPKSAPQGTEKVSRYRPTPLAQAAFVIDALLPPHADELLLALQTPLQGNFRVLQEPSFKAWQVNGGAALSLGVFNRLIYRQDLAEYAATLPNVQGVVQMHVVSRSPWRNGRLLQGVVLGIAGSVGEQRATLDKLALGAEAKRRLQRAPDSEPVLRVRTFLGEVDYPASALHIILMKKDYARLRIDAAAVKAAEEQSITERARAVAAAADVLKGLGVIGDAYRASKQPQQFLGAADYGFGAQVMLGDGQPRPYPRTLWREINSAGMFHVRPQQRPVNIGVVNALGDAPPNDYQAQLLKALAQLGMQVGDVRETITLGLTPQEAHDALAKLGDIDAVLVFQPESEPTAYSADVDWATTVNIKREVLRVGLPSLCLWEANMHSKTAPQEGALAFSLAVGHVPFALGAPLPFCDTVGGWVALRGEKPHYVHIAYSAQGAFIGYVLHSGKLTLGALEKLFPPRYFQNLRVMLHHTEPLPVPEQALLQEYAQKHGVQLMLCLLNAGGNPRMYALGQQGIEQPPTGSAFVMGKNHALLVPATPELASSTVNPLEVISEGVSIQQALHSVLAMNTLHPSLHKPRLPVTVYPTERIRRLLKAGALPTPTEGDLAWWL